MCLVGIDLEINYLFLCYEENLYPFRAFLILKTIFIDIIYRNHGLNGQFLSPFTTNCITSYFGFRVNLISLIFALSLFNNYFTT